MKFFHVSSYLSGVSVPLSALRSRFSAGIGEFPDLVLLAEFAKTVGLDLIQLLPVNDTGFSTSPYNALSAFALHPVYLRLDDLPGAETQKVEIEALRRLTNAEPRVGLDSVFNAKLPILRGLFALNAKRPSWRNEYEVWLSSVSWRPAYVAFCALRTRYHLSGWQSWPEHRRVNSDELGPLVRELGDDAGFFAWLQMCAEDQFAKAARACASLGVAIKGDIPILLNEDSADVWAHPEYFDREWRAGSPPDAENPDGQNWGFPSFRWDIMKKDDFAWWKQRLLHAEKFYHAYRIDHVLGFFRLWVTPQADFTARLGFFRPSQTIHRSQLAALGFDDGRIVWLSEPHIFGLEIRERLGDEAETVIAQALLRVGQEDLYRFKSEIQGESHLSSLTISDGAKSWLLVWYRNRTLLRHDQDTYVTSSHYFETRAYDSLGNEERWNFERLVNGAREASLELWEEQGRRLLGFMRGVSDMLVCAEDLGSIPDCVPVVLNDLEILSLRVVRWARDWKTSGQPYYPVRSYPELSVCTPSVHDTSTLRQWWEEEPDHKELLAALGRSPDEDGPLTTELAAKVLGGLLTTRSRLCIVPLQDWFLLEPAFLSDDPGLERINTPGTVNAENWSYRMKPFVEDLTEASTFVEKLQDLLRVRRAKTSA